MTLQEIYKLAVEMGVEAEPRDDDLRIIYAGTKKEIRRIMVGIEIGPAEIVMAKILKNIDAVMAYQVITLDRTADAAKLLDLPLLKIKTPIDNLAQEFIKKAKEKQKIIPEYFEASRAENKDIAFVSLGMNLFLDKLEEKKINIVPCSGLIRIRRN